jgi:hypothetical protein
LLMFIFCSNYYRAVDWWSSFRQIESNGRNLSHRSGSLHNTMHTRNALHDTGYFSLFVTLGWLSAVSKRNHWRIEWFSTKNLW